MTMTSFVNIVNMNVLDNPATFSSPLQIEITFECTGPLEEDIEWKMLYVGSAENSAFDQTLTEIMVGPVPIGVNSFIFQADAPDPTLIPESDLLGITAILVTGSYRDQEFARVGYYVNNEYKSDDGYDEIECGEQLQLESPLDIQKIIRTVLGDKPRVTRFQIQWTGDCNSDVENSDEDLNMECGDDDHLPSHPSELRSPSKTFIPTGNIVSPDRSLGAIFMDNI